MRFFAQNFEDLILNRLFEDKSDGFYFDVGAFHPEDLSITNFFYKKGWSGLNIEPIEKNFKLFLSKRPRDININCVISNNPSTVDFFLHPKKELSTIIPPSKGLIDSNKSKKIKVKAIKGKKIVAEHHLFNKVDFLKVDTEGSELDVLESFDFEKFKPQVILVEIVQNFKFDVPLYDFINSSKEVKNINRYLKDFDYKDVYFDGLNNFYVKKDNLEFKKKLSYGPSIYDIDLSSLYRQIATNHKTEIKLNKKINFLQYHADERLKIINKKLIKQIKQDI